MNSDLVAIVPHLLDVLVVGVLVGDVKGGLGKIVDRCRNEY